jgi:uncharacterized protein
MEIRDATSADFPAILELNAASVHFLSPLDATRLQLLHGQAAYHRVLEAEGSVRAFLLALCEGADYASPNYRWFAGRYAQFLYIDRVVVADAARGLGLGAQLYEDLFAFARAHRLTRVVCEYDLEPPNPASAQFHARRGFHQIGTQWLDGGRKQVSLQLRELGVAPPEVQYDSRTSSGEAT